MSNKPEECEGCNFVTENLTRYANHRELENNGERWLCEACAGTAAGNAVLYPDLYRNNGDVLKAISYCTNMIIREIRATKRSEG